MNTASRLNRRVLLTGGFSLTLCISAAEGAVQGVILDSRGNPVPGAQLWTDFPRLGVRADSKGAFSLNLNSGDRLYIAGGSATASYRAEKGALKLRLDPVPAPESPAIRRNRGVQLLVTAAQASTQFRSDILLWLARIQPDQARPLAREDYEKAMLLIAAAGRDGSGDNVLLAELDALRDNFARCKAAQQAALALLPRRPDLARGALEIAHRLWEDRSVGGNDLLFPYAALCLKLAPERAEHWIKEADAWAYLAPQSTAERIKLAVELARVDYSRAYTLAKTISRPFIPLALAQMARVLVPAQPQAAMAFLEESQRLTPADPAYEAIYEDAVLALLPHLGDTKREAALALAKKGTSRAMSAWCLRLEAAQQPATRPTAFRERLPQATLAEAASMAEILTEGLEPRLRNEILAALRQRLFTDLAKAPVDAEAIVTFARLIAKIDPAAARAAIERSWRDLGFEAPKLARLAEAMVPVDALRAIQLTDMLENPTWSSLARGRIGHYLASGHWPA